MNTPHTFSSFWTEAEIEAFITQLKHTITWTAQLMEYFDFEGDHERVFRKSNPIVRGLPLYKFGDKTTLHWNHDMHDRELYLEVLKIVTTARASLTEADLNELDSLGRILSFETGVSTHDGAPQAESHAFMDDGDVPPIDTWFFLKDNYPHDGNNCKQVLFCWIPKAFEAIVQEVIEVEILASYQWVDENDFPLYNYVKNSGS